MQLFGSAEIPGRSFSDYWMSRPEVNPGSMIAHCHMYKLNLNEIDIETGEIKHLVSQQLSELEQCKCTSSHLLPALHCLTLPYSSQSLVTVVVMKLDFQHQPRSGDSPGWMHICRSRRVFQR